jgi:hypothetical protein
MSLMPAKEIVKISEDPSMNIFKIKITPTVTSGRINLQRVIDKGIRKAVVVIDANPKINRGK